MSSLLKVLWLSVTTACTVGLKPLMFPTGPTEVMVTPPLAPPRPDLGLAPDLVLGFDLCDVFRLLDLPTLAPISKTRVRRPRTSYRRDPHDLSLRLRRDFTQDAEPHARDKNPHAAPCGSS